MEHQASCGFRCVVFEGDLDILSFSSGAGMPCSAYPHAFIIYIEMNLRCTYIFPYNKYSILHTWCISFLASCRPQRFLDSIEVMGKDSEGKGRSEGNFAAVGA